jgi:hypothetical protein
MLKSVFELLRKEKRTREMGLQVLVSQKNTMTNTITDRIWAE